MIGARGLGVSREVIKSYKDLDVWKKSIEFVKKAYKFTQRFPKEETYGLIGQIRRSAVSISSNIAEGRSRHHTNEFIQFLYTDEKNKNELLEELDQIGRMLMGLIKSLK